MTRTIGIVLGSIFTLSLILGVAVFFGLESYAPPVYVKEVKNGTTTDSITVNTSTGTSTPGAPVYTREQVALHKDAASCHTIIDGKVYDLTLWVNMHPGGKNAILSLCGSDGTDSFMNKHKGAQKQMDILGRFHIGNLQAN